MFALLNAGADIDARGAGGWTPLQFAAGFASTAAIAVLVRHGANVNTTDSDGDSPLVTAAALGYDDTVQQLLANGANPRLASPKVGPRSLLF